MRFLMTRINHAVFSVSLLDLQNKKNKLENDLQGKLFLFGFTKWGHFTVPCPRHTHTHTHRVLYGTLVLKKYRSTKGFIKAVYCI